MSEDVSNLRSQKSATESQVSSAESRRSAAKEKISRLKKAKESVDNLKTDVKDLSKDMRNWDSLGESWVGVNYTDYNQHLTGSFKMNYSDYHRGVDDVLDAICDEITRLENETFELDGIIGILYRKINSLINEIEKVFN